MALPIKFSVITVAYNAEGVIGRTFNSVEEQDYPWIEHVIVDGNSTDKTLEKLHLYMARNSNVAHRREIVCLSENDKGIYDAMNKGIALATGRYLVFLNAGDKFHAPDTLTRAAKSISQETKQPAVAYGDTHLVDNFGNFIRRRRLTPPEQLQWQDFRAGMLVCHQSFYVRADLAKETKYDLRYRFSSDFDWCIRIMQKAEKRQLDLLNTHLVLTDYLSEGMTTRNRSKSWRERYDIMSKYFGWGATFAEHIWFVFRAFLKK